MEWLIVLLWLITAPLWLPVVFVMLVVVLAIVMALVVIPIAMLHDFGRTNGWWR